MNAAQRLMLKHNLDAVASRAARGYAHRHLRQPHRARRRGGRCPPPRKSTSSSSASGSACMRARRPARLGARACGTPRTSTLAEYVHSFLHHTAEGSGRPTSAKLGIPRRPRPRRLPRGRDAGASFPETQRRAASQEKGLVWARRPRARDLLTASATPYVRTIRRAGGGSADARPRPQAGRSLVLHKGVSSGAAAAGSSAPAAAGTRLPSDGVALPARWFDDEFHPRAPDPPRPDARPRRRGLRRALRRRRRRPTPRRRRARPPRPHRRAARIVRRRPLRLRPAAVRYAPRGARSTATGSARRSAGWRTSPTTRAAHLQPLRAVPLDGLAIATSLLLDREPRGSCAAWSSAGRRRCRSCRCSSRAWGRSSASPELPAPPRARRGDPGLPRGVAGASRPFSGTLPADQVRVGLHAPRASRRSPRSCPCRPWSAPRSSTSPSPTSPASRSSWGRRPSVIPQLLLPGGFLPVPVK